MNGVAARLAFATALAAALVCVTPPAGGGSDCGEEEKVNWLDYEQALELAREKDRPVVLVFYEDACRKCEVLEKKGFNRPQTACYVNQMLAPARIRGCDRPDLKRKYGVGSYPMVWFLTPKAEKIDYFTGYVPPERLMFILQYIGDKSYRDMSFEEYEKKQK